MERGGKNRIPSLINTLNTERRVEANIVEWSKKTGKESGRGWDGNTKGYFNSLLSSVAERKEEKVTPLPCNYLVNAVGGEEKVSTGETGSASG